MHFAKINKLDFEISCLQTSTTHRQTQPSTLSAARLVAEEKSNNAKRE